MSAPKVEELSVIF